LIKNYFKIPLFFFLVSCLQDDFTLSKVAKINEENRYVNNYIDDYSVERGKFFEFLWNNLFNKPEKKEFQSVLLSKEIYNKKSHILSWGGHSTILYQNTDLNILVDPVFSERVSPIFLLGPKRYMPSPFNIFNLPKVDIVAISHNHYDHLDLKTIKDLEEKFPDLLFLVPLGLKGWFLENGIENVREFDWWETMIVKKTKIEFVPVQHWSKRTLFDKNKSLWGGWWFEHNSKSFLHLGDTGYSKDFIDIRNKLGSPDIVAIPIGAFEPRYIMKNSHLNPEEAVQTFKDLGAKIAVAIHWGTFILSQEKVDEPIKRLKRSLIKNLIEEERFRILKHGESILVD
jgi:L-ascorbate metabolism protein UlaG (beta-lactamase superfamily)